MSKVDEIKKILKQQVFIIMVGTLLSKFLGLIRDSVLAKYYGASLLTDSYIIATLIPSILIGILATAVLSTYIPVLNAEKQKGKEKEFTNNFVNICIVLITLLIGIYFVFNEQIVSIFVIGFSGEELNTIVKMTDIAIFASYPLVLISIYSGYLQNKNKFIATSFYGLIFNIISILGICISYNRNYLIMPIMFVIGYVISLIVLIINSIRYGYRYSFEFNLKDEAIKKIFLLTLPVLFNSIVWDINVVIDKSLISTVGTGFVSALNYSYKIIGVATGVIATSISVYIFPKLSEMYQKKDNNGMNKIVSNSLLLLFVLLVPITIFISIFAEPIIRILFMRGNFDDNALDITKTALQLYAISIMPIGINTILYKVFNSMQKNRIPAVNAIISIVINIVFNLLFIKPLGYKGIIIATAISNIIAMIFIIIRTRRECVNINYKMLLFNLIKIIVAVAVASVTSIYVYKYIEFNIFIETIITVITFGVIYISMLLVQRVKFKSMKI